MKRIIKTIAVAVLILLFFQVMFTLWLIIKIGGNLDPEMQSFLYLLTKGAVIISFMCVVIVFLFVCGWIITRSLFDSDNSNKPKP